MSHTNTLSALRAICHTAHKIRKLTESHATQATQAISLTSVSVLPPRTFPELQLPFPEEVLSTLISMGLPKNVHGHLQKKLVIWYQQLQAVHQRHYIQTCQRLCSVSTHIQTDSVFESIRLAFEASFSKRYIPLIASHIRGLKERCRCEWSEKQKSRRQPFQQASTPLLEEYFERNAYPSASDRAALASKTMNTPRQIEVWFQNHRNRAKKEGRTLKRSNSPSIICDLFSSVASSVDSDSGPSDQYSYTASEDDEERGSDHEHLNPPTAMTKIPDLLNPPRPAHAFPTAFSKRSSFDPFEKKDGLFKISPLNWPRQPAPARSHSRLQVDFDGFISEFAEKLHLRDMPPKKQIPHPRKARLGSHLPWFYSTVVVPQKAPLPSLVRTSSPYPASTPYPGLASPSSSIQIPSINSSFRRHCTPQLGAELRHCLPRFPSDFSSRVYPSWNSRTSSMSSISSTEPITPPASPPTENSDLKIAGVDYDILQEILDPTTSSSWMTDAFNFPDTPYSKDSTLFQFSPIPSSEDIFSGTI